MIIYDYIYIYVYLWGFTSFENPFFVLGYMETL
jgi:hypothetical protein